MNNDFIYFIVYTVYAINKQKWSAYLFIACTVSLHASHKSRTNIGHTKYVQDEISLLMILDCSRMRSLSSSIISFR